MSAAIQTAVFRARGRHGLSHAWAAGCAPASFWLRGDVSIVAGAPNPPCVRAVFRMPPVAVDCGRCSESPRCVRGQAQYDAEQLYVRFDVEEPYVLGRHTEPNSAVFTDSCVEFFLQARARG
eukprot:5473473-Prymnesium_polylepis.1